MISEFVSDKISLTNIDIVSYYKGRASFLPVSYPSFEGIKHLIRFNGYKFIFDLTGHIKLILNDSADWPDHFIKIKRTIANEWIIYLSYGYEDIYSLTGVYYIPIRESLSYVPIWLDNPFKNNCFEQTIKSFKNLIISLSNYNTKNIKVDFNISKIIAQIVRVNKLEELRKQANIFHHILKGTVPILPPDTITVDYNVIPIFISDGCLYNCRFCCLKTGNEWRQRTNKEIIDQIYGLRDFLSDDIINYSAIFLGQNDALSSSPDILLETARIAFKVLLDKSIFKEKTLYLFGSTTSLLNTPRWIFKELDKIGYRHIYINCGLESFEQDVLNMIGKPITSKEVEDAYRFSVDINKDYSCVEISLNFLISESFPEIHLKTLLKKLSNPTTKLPKGTIYLSPMIGESYTLRKLKRIIFNLKSNSKWDIKLYIMQGL